MTTRERISPNVFTQSPVVITGRLTDVIPMGMSLGEPPFFHVVVCVTPVTVLRGTTIPQQLHLFRMVEATHALPAVDERVWLMAATKLDETWGVTTWALSVLVPVEDASLAVAERATRVPMGWTITDSQFVSPWGIITQPQWPERAIAPSGPLCALSGRPALFVGSDFTLTVQSRPRFLRTSELEMVEDLELTVTNHAAVPRTVPALLTDGRVIRWADSLVVLAQDGFFWLPGRERTVTLLPDAGTGTALHPVQLQPGESVSTCIPDNVLQQLVRRVTQPGQVHLQFCLGEHSVSWLFHVRDSHTEERDDEDNPFLVTQVSRAQILFTGRRQPPPAGQETRLVMASASNPPIIHLPVQFDEVQVLRGTFDPTGHELIYRVIGRGSRLLPEADRWLVGMTEEHGIEFMVPADATRVELAKQVAGLPRGWMLHKGAPISPWAVRESQAPVTPTRTMPMRACARSGRPAWQGGPAIALTSTQVPPAQRQEYVNPFGDGQFTLTVTNRGNTVLEVPALRTDGQTIAWVDSLVVLGGSAFYWLPGGGNMAYLLSGAYTTRPSQPVRLQPGECVSTVVDLLPLTQFQQSGGGNRIYYQCCVGELSTTTFFYFSGSAIVVMLHIW